MSRFPRRAAGCAVAIAMAVAGLRAAPQQGPAASPTAAPRTAEQQFKNIQVLKGVPASQINPSMHLIAGELGVECQFCHIWEKWDREDKPAKQVARRMLAMTADINKTMFGGEQVITCYTCHRGHPKPINTVVLPVPRPPSVDNPPPPPVLPAVDEILAKYIQSLGGEHALRRVTTRVMTGTRDIPSGPGGMIPLTTNVEIRQQAPNLFVATYATDKTMLTEGFDGVTAWTRGASGYVASMPAPEQGRFRRSASLYEPLDLAKNYSSMRVRGIETIGAHQAYVVVAVIDGDEPEELSFDTRTGLLLRRAWTIPTAAGKSPFQIE